MSKFLDLSLEDMMKSKKPQKSVKKPNEKPQQRKSKGGGKEKRSSNGKGGGKAVASSADKMDMGLEDIIKKNRSKRPSKGDGKKAAITKRKAPGNNKSSALSAKRALADRVKQKLQKPTKGKGKAASPSKGKGKGKKENLTVRKRPSQDKWSSSWNGNQRGGDWDKWEKKDDSWSSSWKKNDSWSDSWKKSSSWDNDDRSNWSSWDSKKDTKKESKGKGKGSKGGSWSSDWKKGSSWSRPQSRDNRSREFLRDDYAQSAPLSRRGRQSDEDFLPENIRRYANNKTCIKIGNCPDGLNKSELRQAFEEVGKVTHVELDSSKGIAFLVFADPKAALEAEHAFDGGEMNGSTIKISVL